MSITLSTELSIKKIDTLSNPILKEAVNAYFVADKNAEDSIWSANKAFTVAFANMAKEVKERNKDGVDIPRFPNKNSFYEFMGVSSGKGSNILNGIKWNEENRFHDYNVVSDKHGYHREYLFNPIVSADFEGATEIKIDEEQSVYVDTSVVISSKKADIPDHYPVYVTIKDMGYKFSKVVLFIPYTMEDILVFLGYLQSRFPAETMGIKWLCSQSDSTIKSMLNEWNKDGKPTEYKTMKEAQDAKKEAQDAKKDAEPSQDTKKDAEPSQDAKKDAEPSQDAKKDTKKDAEPSQDAKKDAEPSQDAKKDAEPSQDAEPSHNDIKREDIAADLGLYANDDKQGILDTVIWCLDVIGGFDIKNSKNGSYTIRIK